MIAHVDRPASRVTNGEDGRWRVHRCRGCRWPPTGRRGALDEARAAIAEWLSPDAFDVEMDERTGSA